MANLPSYVNVLYQGQRRKWDPSVERTEMERGVPKQRLTNSQVLVKQPMSLYFATLDDALQFEDWYFDALDRIGWFEMIDPIDGTSRTVRFENGSIGELAPDEKEPGDYRRDVVVEYLR